MTAIPNKIYIAGDLEGSEYASHLWCDEPQRPDDLEYTHLDGVWHDANELPTVGAMLLIEGSTWQLGRRRDYDAAHCDGTPFTAHLYQDDRGAYIEDVTRWAYVKDLLPKGGKR